MSSIFGGSKSKSRSTQRSFSSSSSYNQAFPSLQANYGASGANAFNTANNQLKSELSGGFAGYRDKTGFDFFEKLGLDKVGGQFSGRGAFQSGAALKSLANYENNLEKASYDSYLDKLYQQAQLGLGAGQLVAGAGGKSTSQSNSSGYSTSSGKNSPGFGGFIGSAIGGIAASDRRLKKDINRVGELPNGLGLYEYWYINDAGPYIGVMADEVEAIMPEALGPVIDGYKTVDYNKIRELV